MKLLKNDLIILFILLACAGLLFFAMRSKDSVDGNYVLITLDGKEYARLPLDNDTYLDINSEFGSNRIRITAGEVFMESADCPDKICVHHKNIHAQGESIVCLPHKLVVTICSQKESDIDAISQ